MLGVVFLPVVLFPAKNDFPEARVVNDFFFGIISFIIATKVIKKNTYQIPSIYIATMLTYFWGTVAVMLGTGRFHASLN